MKTILIAAIARNGVIGRTSKPCSACNGDGKRWSPGPWIGTRLCGCDVCGPPGVHDFRGTGRVPANDIPWSYPEYDAHFDAVTNMYPVIMGRRTWEGLKVRPIPKADTNIVVTKDDAWAGDNYYHVGGWHTYSSLGGAICACSVWGKERAYIIGGAQLYAAALPLADELDLTLFDRDYEGDIRFPCGDLFTHPSTKHIVNEGASPWSFSCIERRNGETPELTFTKWIRR